MTKAQSTVQQTPGNNYAVEKLPDGSTAVLDRVTSSVHSLDATAAAVFEACGEPAKLAALTSAAQRNLGREITEEVVLEAVSELERAGLVTVLGGREAIVDSSRRSLLKAAGFAVPVVLSLTAAQQRAYAATAGSGPPPTTTAAPTTTTAAPTTTTAAPGGGSVTSAIRTGSGNDNGISCSAYAPPGNTPTPVNYTITGVGTHFSNSSVVTFSDPALSATNVVASSATSLTCDVTEYPYVTYNELISVYVTTGTYVETGANLLHGEEC